MSWSAVGIFLFILFALGVFALEQEPADKPDEVDDLNTVKTADITDGPNQLLEPPPPAPPKTARPNVPSPRSTDDLRAASNRDIEIDGVQRRYRIVVPEGSADGIVIAFHGTGESAEAMAGYSGLDSLASSRLVVVYPAALKGMWRTMQAPDALLSENPDLRFCLELMPSLVAEFDTNRMSLVGMSNGAAFAQLLGTVSGSAVEAVVAHSGSRPEISPPPSGDFRFLGIVGENDLAQTAMQDDLKLYREAGHNAELLVVPSLGHAWASNQSDRIRGFLVAR